VAAATLQAVRASGVIVSVTPEVFLDILQRQQAPLVVQATAVWLFGMGTTYQFLTSYKGLAFYAKSSTPVTLPPRCEIVQASSIWVPG